MLKPITKKLKKYVNYGFDIETFVKDGVHKTFLISLFMSEEEFYFFEEKKEFIDFLIKNKDRFQSARIFATNLGFDFIGSFFGEDSFEKFQFIMRGSDFISCFTYIMPDDTLSIKPDKNRNAVKLIFSDTMNFFPGGVAEMGKIVGNAKMQAPEYLGKRKPINQEEWDYFRLYNLNDSRITKMFADFMQDSFNSLGAEMKLTIASTSMNLFQRKYLKHDLWTPSLKDIELQQRSYYGGRTETFMRGRKQFEFIGNIKCYDFNSLYPSVMNENKFPHPNRAHRVKKISINQIKNFEGCCYCEFMKPDDGEIPLLPVRHENKLIFPYGDIKGYYTFIEIREALQNNYILKKIGDGIYYDKTIDLFSEYVTDLYEKRMSYKREKSMLELPVKILMTSLYGKMAQKTERKEIIHMDLMRKDDWTDFFRFGDTNYCRVTRKTPQKKLTFTIPIIASYVTSYARIKLFRKIKLIHKHVIAVDTDSIFTELALPHSDRLGDIKLEYITADAYFVKPKMYAVKLSDGKFKIKIKGLGMKFRELEQFRNLIMQGATAKQKYIKVSSKFKESLIQKIPQMSYREIEKNFSMEDDKRDWLGKKFNVEEFQESKALII